jgi:hypothetical protein
MWQSKSLARNNFSQPQNVSLALCYLLMAIRRDPRGGIDGKIGAPFSRLLSRDTILICTPFSVFWGAYCTYVGGEKVSGTFVSLPVLPD